MQTQYQNILNILRHNPKTWLVTGVAGFIGSNLLETLLDLDQQVVGVDNFSTGYHRNLEEIRSRVTPDQWTRFTFIKGDICDLQTCRKAVNGISHVLHQAALGSVPRSFEDPLGANETNVKGFLNILVAARDAKVESFVYASSSSIYGDDPGLPKKEDKIGRPLSPYAVTKFVNELYADVFARNDGLRIIGLRYFNVFGRRQDPSGAYAAVIPLWFDSLLRGETVYINGDGMTSRDFCYIDNCVQANILSATTQSPEATNQVYNIALGEQTTLNALFDMIKSLVAVSRPEVVDAKPVYRDFRLGDVRHSLADIGKAKRLIAYEPQFSVALGLELAAPWYGKLIDIKKESSH